MNMNSDPNCVNLIFKDILTELSNPIIHIDDLENTFNFIINDLNPLYENQDDVKTSIEYVVDIFSAINTIANSINQSELKNDDEFKKSIVCDLTVITDKYFTVTDTNKYILESKYIIIQNMIKACFYQILKILFLTLNDKDMDTDDIPNAIKLFNDFISDNISNINKSKIIEI
jgi:hypothetical protein